MSWRNYSWHFTPCPPPVEPPFYFQSAPAVTAPLTGYYIYLFTCLTWLDSKFLEGGDCELLKLESRSQHSAWHLTRRQQMFAKGKVMTAMGRSSMNWEEDAHIWVPVLFCFKETAASSFTAQATTWAKGPIPPWSLRTGQVQNRWVDGNGGFAKNKYRGQPMECLHTRLGQGSVLQK